VTVQVLNNLAFFLENSKTKNPQKCELLDAFCSELLFLIETEQLSPDTCCGNL